MESSTLSLVSPSRTSDPLYDSHPVRAETDPLSPGRREPGSPASGVNVRRGTGEGQQRKKTSLLARAATHLHPDHKLGPTPSAWRSIRAVILASCKYSSPVASFGYSSVYCRAQRSPCVYSNICTVFCLRSHHLANS